MNSSRAFFLILIVCVATAPFIESKALPQNNDERPSVWIKRTFSRAGNSLGRGTIAVTNTAEKLCNLVKKIVPIVAQICAVAKFKFCAGAQFSGEPTQQEEMPDVQSVIPLDNREGQIVPSNNNVEEFF